MKKRERFIFTVFGPPKTKDKILVGDVLRYIPTVHVQGNLDTHYQRTQATVLSVNPDGEYKVELSTGDCLPDNHKVKRINIIKNNNLIDYPGRTRWIDSCVLETQISFLDQQYMLGSCEQ